MTSDLLIKIVVLTILLVGLDWLILSYRRAKFEQRSSFLSKFLDKLTVPLIAWFTRQQRALQTAISKIKLPQKTETAPSQPETEPVTSQEIVIDNEIPATVESLPLPQGQMARVQVNAEVPPDTIIHITITTDHLGRAAVEQQAQPLKKQRSTLRAPSRKLPTLNLPKFNWQAWLNIPANRLAAILFWGVLGVYLVTRLVGLENFPIYFFGDEAVQTTSAADLLSRGLRGPDGTFLPTYFQNGAYYNLSTSVYLQAISLLLFAKSIFMARASSVLVTLLAVIAVGLILKNAFQAKHWWLASVMLSLAPAWFLHSRTAFETALFVSFYAGFLYFYLEYRLHEPKKVYWAVLMAGLAFYSYSPGQLVLATTGLLLFINDLPYHWQQRQTLLKALIVVFVIAIPYERFRLTVDYSPLDHLRQLGSYWIQPFPLTAKLAMFGQQYLYGLSPQYWFFANNTDLERHQMLGYGNLAIWMLPLLLTGLGVALYRFRSTAHRVVLLAGLAAPAGAALAQIGITRVLVFVVPATLLAALGLNFILELIENLGKKSKSRLFSTEIAINLLAVVTFAGLAALNLAMLNNALRNGPTWFTDYGLYGMQYGAKQVYQETVVPGLKNDPQAYYVVTPSWANGAEQFVGFFVPPELRSRIMLGQVYDILDQKPTPTNETYFIVTPEEFEKITSDPKFKEVVVRSTIPYPNGATGFYILNIKFVDNIDEILAAEIVEENKPVEETVDWRGQNVRIIHSRFNDGTIVNLVDNDPNTLVRGERANPIMFEFFFEQPIPVSQLVLTTGSMANFDVTVQLYAPGSETPIEYKQNFLNEPDDPTVNLSFPNGPATSDHIILYVRDNRQGQVAQVHIREVLFK